MNKQFGSFTLSDIIGVGIGITGTENIWIVINVFHTVPDPIKMSFQHASIAVTGCYCQMVRLKIDGKCIVQYLVNKTVVCIISD